jgi:hypothetical protein
VWQQSRQDGRYPRRRLSAHRGGLGELKRLPSEASQFGGKRYTASLGEDVISAPGIDGDQDQVAGRGGAAAFTASPK